MLQLLRKCYGIIRKVPFLVFILQALFMTDNSSVDAAASWVLDNQHLPDIDEPFKVGSLLTITIKL